MRRIKQNTETSNPNPGNKLASVKRTRASYSHRIEDQNKDQRRKEAEVRNAAWNELTLEQKIRALAKRPGESRKQIKKLIGRDISAKEARASLSTILSRGVE